MAGQGTRSELQGDTLGRLDPRVAVLSLGAPDELTELGDRVRRNLVRCGCADLLKYRLDVDGEVPNAWVSANLTSARSGHEAQALGVGHGTCQARVGVLRDFLEPEYGAHRPEPSVPWGPRSEELLHSANNVRDRLVKGRLLRRHECSMLDVDLEHEHARLPAKREEPPIWAAPPLTFSAAVCRRSGVCQ
jgi:hypothetical protein